MRFVVPPLVLRAFAFAAAATLLFIVAARAAEDDSPPPAADELVRRVIAADEAARVRRQGLEYDFSTTTARLNAAGEVLKTKTDRGVARPNREFQFTADIASEPGATAEDRARSQREMQESQRMQATMTLKRLAPHFDYTLEGSAVVEGRGCWVLAYRPKPGAPAATREEAVLNRLTGRSWIDKATNLIVRNDGSLPAPVSLAFIASMNKLSFRYRSQPLPNGDLGPASFNLEVNVTAPLYYFEQRQTSTMANYRPAR